MSYRKQISYLELQENGQRIRGAGYAKLESWEKEEILMVQLRGQGIVSGKEMLLYLQRESGEELLCEMTAERGTISCEKRIFRKADWEPTLGIRIPLERNFEIIGRFAGAAGAKKVPAPVTAIAPVTVGEIEAGNPRRRLHAAGDTVKYGCNRRHSNDPSLRAGDPVVGCNILLHPDLPGQQSLCCNIRIHMLCIFTQVQVAKYSQIYQ